MSFILSDFTQYDLTTIPLNYHRTCYKTIQNAINVHLRPFIIGSLLDRLKFPSLWRDDGRSSSIFSCDIIPGLFIVVVIIVLAHTLQKKPHAFCKATSLKFSDPVIPSKPMYQFTTSSFCSVLKQIEVACVAAYDREVTGLNQCPRKRSTNFCKSTFCPCNLKTPLSEANFRLVSCELVCERGLAHANTPFQSC